MIKVLINDGIHPTGQKMMEEAGLHVENRKIAQEELIQHLDEFDAICIRSATKIKRELLDGCPNLKIIARGGVGLDNVDVDHARSLGKEVYNTPGASSRSVAELVFGHILTLARNLHKSNRIMPVDGDSEFDTLKKSLAKGMSIEGKNIGIIGLGKIGCELAKMALGLGMNVYPVDSILKDVDIKLTIAGKDISVNLKMVEMDHMLANCDIISLHVPYMGFPVIGEREFVKMKRGMLLINASRGGTVDEVAMLKSLDTGNLQAVGLDVYENEPNPNRTILKHPNISLTPHIGASTLEAQENIGIELAEKIIAYFKTV